MNAPTSFHPSDQTLSSYGLGKLDDILADAVNRHLEGCPDCRRRVVAMSGDSFLGRIRDAQAGKSMFGVPQTGGSRSDKRSSAPPPRDTMPSGLADHPDYEIKRELGRGGMGVVYLAHNRLMGRDEVLKVMGRQIMERPGVLDRFLREIRAVAKLRHPNIVTAYSRHPARREHRLRDGVRRGSRPVQDGQGQGAAADRPRLQLRPPGGPRAPARPRGGARPPRHQAGQPDALPHRKTRRRSRSSTSAWPRRPARRRSTRGLTSEGQALGTPDYIAPEQILDAPSADIRADIYSLGGTLYYLLTGRPPFQANSLYDMYQAHISRDADPLNLVRPEVPAELAALVAKMMAKDPARRFQTPGEVAQALTPFFKKGNLAFNGPRTDVSRDGQTAASQTETGPVSISGERATDAERPVFRVKKSTAMASRRPEWESLIALRESGGSAEDKPRVEPMRRPPWKKWPIATAGSLFGLIALGVLIITIRDRNGLEFKNSARMTSRAGSRPPTRRLSRSNHHEMTQRAGDQWLAPSFEGGWTVTRLINHKSRLLLMSMPPSSNSSSTARILPAGDYLETLLTLGVWFKAFSKGSGPPSLSLLTTARTDYANFHLRVETKMAEGPNSGIALGMTECNGDWARYIAHIPGTGEGENGAGSLSLSQTLGPASIKLDKADPVVPIKPGEWFTEEVIADGNVITVLVQGIEVAKFKSVTK